MYIYTNLIVILVMECELHKLKIQFNFIQVNRSTKTSNGWVKFLSCLGGKTWCIKSSRMSHTLISQCVWYVSCSKPFHWSRSSAVWCTVH